MKTDRLKEYLEIVVDVEKNIFLQNKLLSEIRQEIETLKLPKILPDPEYPKEPQEKYIPAPPSIPSPLKEVVIITVKSIVGGYGLMAGVGLITLLIAMMVDADWPVIFCIFPPIIWIRHCIRTGRQKMQGHAQTRIKYQQELEQAQSEYQEKVKQYQQMVKEYPEILKENERKRQQDTADRQAKIVYLQKQVKEIKDGLDISQKHLQKIYDEDIIFPKYRNLPMVCSLYEYICSERCDKLVGNNGAYNILEVEIRMDRLISQMDLVIAHLEQIQRNQFMLYSALQECNRRSMQIRNDLNCMSVTLEGIFQNTAELNQNTDQLYSRIAELQETSSLAAYYVERTHKELAFMNRMEYLMGRNNNAFFASQPPLL